MFGFGRKKTSKHSNTARALALHGKVIRYVARRENGMEVVIGHGGNISVKDNQLLVFSSHNIVFRSECAKTEISFLLSGDGVILKAANLEKGGVEDSVTAFFVDHIK